MDALKIIIGLVTILAGGFAIDLLSRINLMDSIASAFVYLGALIVLSMVCYAIGDAVVGLVGGWIKSGRNEDKEIQSDGER